MSNTHCDDSRNDQNKYETLNKYTIMRPDAAVKQPISSSDKSTHSHFHSTSNIHGTIYQERRYLAHGMLGNLLPLSPIIAQFTPQLFSAVGPAATSLTRACGATIPMVSRGYARIFPAFASCWLHCVRTKARNGLTLHTSLTHHTHSGYTPAATCLCTFSNISLSSSRCLHSITV